MKKLSRLCLAVLLPAALALQACSDGRAAEPAKPPPGSKPGEPPPAQGPQPMTSAKTPWVKARAAEGVSLLEAPALVLPAPEGIAAVAPPFRARVARLAVRAGERVKKGEVVAEVVMPDVIQAAGAHAAATTRVTAYAKRREQLQALRKDGMVKLSDLLEAETKLAEARADQQAALGTLRAADLTADDAPRLLQSGGRVALKSPIDGVVTEVKGTLGETREAAGDPIARIAAESETRVEARLAHVPPPSARYELLTPDGQRHALTFVGRAPIVDARDGTTATWFSPVAAARLPAGLAGRLAVKLEGAAAAVPAKAVALEGKTAYVVRNVDGAPRKVEVEVLSTSGADALVRGLNPGDEIAADAALAAGGEK